MPVHDRYLPPFRSPGKDHAANRSTPLTRTRAIHFAYNLSSNPVCEDRI